MEIKGTDLFEIIQNFAGESIEEKLNKIIFKDTVPFSQDKFFACLAGGSVADLLFQEKINQKKSINDIDIFISQPVKNLSEYNDVEYFINSKNNASYYRITEVIWDKKFNFIKVFTSEPCLNEKEFAQYIIKGFDMNACQAAISLDEKKLYTTPEFNYFLETKDLRITNPHNIASTALRLFKKNLNLNLNSDINREMEILISSYFYYAQKKYMGTLVKTSNPKTKYLNYVMPYFNIKLKNDGEFGEYYSFEPKKSKDILSLENHNFVLGSSLAFNRYLTFDEIRELYERKKKELSGKN